MRCALLWTPACDSTSCWVAETLGLDVNSGCINRVNMTALLGVMNLWLILRFISYSSGIDQIAAIRSHSSILIPSSKQHFSNDIKDPWSFQGKRKTPLYSLSLTEKESKGTRGRSHCCDCRLIPWGEEPKINAKWKQRLWLRRRHRGCWIISLIINTGQ